MTLTIEQLKEIKRIRDETRANPKKREDESFLLWCHRLMRGGCVEVALRSQDFQFLVDDLNKQMAYGPGGFSGKADVMINNMRVKDGGKMAWTTWND